MLSIPPSRHLLNFAYNNFGANFKDVFNYIAGNQTISDSFDWQIQFGTRTIIVPVSPEFARSWANARVWGWVGSRAIRQFYEFYLEAKPSGVLIDAGANDGMYTYPFAAHGYQCFAFEPQQSCIAFIKEVCEKNRYANIIVEQQALSDQHGCELDFFTSESSWFSSLNQQHVESHEDSRRTRVRTTTLDVYCQSNAITPTIIKIDTEGAENRVLKGGQNTIGKYRPSFIIEVDAQFENPTTVWEMLSQYNYSCYALDEELRRHFRRVANAEVFSKVIEGRLNKDFVFLADAALIAQFETAFTLT